MGYCWTRGLWQAEASFLPADGGSHSMLLLPCSSFRYVSFPCWKISICHTAVTGLFLSLSALFWQYLCWYTVPGYPKGKRHLQEFWSPHLNVITGLTQQENRSSKILLSPPDTDFKVGLDALHTSGEKMPFLWNPSVSGNFGAEAGAFCIPMNPYARLWPLQEIRCVDTCIWSTGASTKPKPLTEQMDGSYQIPCSPVFHHIVRVILGFQGHFPWRALFQAVSWQMQKDLLPQALVWRLPLQPKGLQIEGTVCFS